MRQKKIKLFTIYTLVLGFFAFVLSAEAVAAGVSLSATPTTNTVTVGQTATYTIKINRDNYTDKVTLSATGLPSGVTATFTPNTTTATSSTLKLQTLTTTPVGTFNINVKGTATGITITPIIVKLTTIAAPAISISTLPEAQSIIAGQSTFFDIKINRTGFTGAVVLSAENVPSGVNVVFEPQETTGNTSRMWLYSPGLPPFPQNYQINVTSRRLGFALPISFQSIQLNVNCGMIWSAQGFPEFNVSELATVVTSDTSGNVYTAGHYFPTINTQEIWVAKYSPNGTKVWLRTVTLNNVAGLEKQARAIAVDSGGNIYVGGYTLTMNPNTSDFDAFIAKFDTNGVQNGNLVFGRNNYEDGVGGMDIRFDPSGSPVMTSTFDRRGTANNSNFDIGRVSLDSNLTNYFIQDVGIDMFGNPEDLAVGSDGSIYVVGKDFFNNNFFGFVKKFGANGNQIYDNPFPAQQLASRVAADANGNAFVAGTIFSNSSDVWTAKLNTQGTQQWINFDATSAAETIGDLAADANGNLIYVGSTKGNLGAINPNAGGGIVNERFDGYIAKRNGTNGSLFFLRQFPVAGNDNFPALTLDNAGNALFAGNTENFNNVHYGGSDDVLLVKYSLGGIVLLPPFPFITRPNPASVRGGTQFTIEGGNFFGVQGIFFDGQALAFTVVSSSRITATAPTVTTSRTGNLTISASCIQNNSPVQLTVTP